MNNKALFILHCYPPIHGASKVGESILNSTIINKNLKTRFIKIKASNSLKEIGKFSFYKLTYSLILFFKVIFFLIFFRPNIIYYTPSPKGFAFYRDFLVSIPIKIFKFFRPTSVFYHYHARGIKEFTSISRLTRKMTEFFLSGNTVIFISSHMKSELDHLKSCPKILFLNNGVEDAIETSEFNDVIKKKIEDDTINVLYLSNMIREKGYDTALELAKSVKDLELHNIKFHFAGAWSSELEKDYFENFVKTNRISEYVKYHGMVRGAQKKKLFTDAKIFLFPSRYEKEIFPLSLLEALSYGLPIIAFDAGAVKNILNKKIGIISNKANLLQSFILAKKKYLNQETFINCRNTYLRNYTSEKFEMNLLKILKS